MRAGGGFDPPFRFADLRRDNGDAHAGLRAGLLAAQAAIPAKYFYDALGSRLFAAICCLPEYPLMRSEARLFAERGDEIAAAAGRGRLLIDLGAGDCGKAERLFPLLAPAGYIALDISADFLREALGGLCRRFPELPVTGVALDFMRGLNFPEDLLAPAQAPRLWFYPGSSIGNFAPEEARAFLSRIAHAGGALLIGVDLVKDKAALEAAYDDALGVTAAFNLNVLRHVNRLLPADFDVADWRHVAFFDAAASRIEMHLEARRNLEVRLAGQPRRFAAGERIHTEDSYKWTPDGFAALLEQAGFARPRIWQDDGGGFALFLAGPA
ncbi:MAG: L-histidine N(alpha)-methyltransferase [Rhodocyclaceae bacterium]|jgi:dimethylhistidine N-methyltransferase|nr:L-histidine N(alpha)-methyltransferase [Rhodocyclaceae bacterium]MCC6878833.1 L-histidine N(alpha)-methyltransferase [Rhodocyclaceae bacterium]